jgi:hypothetical protein
MPRWVRSIIPLAALLFGAEAIAQGSGSGGAPRPPWFEACIEDIMKFCPNPKGKEQVQACLQKHEAELSAKCKEFKAHPKQ